MGRKIKMDKRILYALVWLSMRNTSIHVPQAKEHAFFYKLAECKQPRMTGLSTYSPGHRMINTRTCWLSLTGSEVRLPLSRLETCSVYLVIARRVVMGPTACQLSVKFEVYLSVSSTISPPLSVVSYAKI